MSLPSALCTQWLECHRSASVASAGLFGSPAVICRKCGGRELAGSVSQVTLPARSACEHEALPPASTVTRVPSPSCGTVPVANVHAGIAYRRNLNSLLWQASSAQFIASRQVAHRRVCPRHLGLRCTASAPPSTERLCAMQGGPGALPLCVP